MNVVAAVIERDGKVLICQRKRGGRHALKWEFPGGKVEKNEEPPEALARELREELGIDAQIGEQIDTHEVRYPGGGAISLRFYRVTEWNGEPQNLDFEQFLWEQKPKLPDYDFLEGDIAFVRKLSAE